MVVVIHGSDKEESHSELPPFELRHRPGLLLFASRHEDRPAADPGGLRGVAHHWVRALRWQVKSVVRRVLWRALYALPSRLRSRLASMIPEFLGPPALRGSTDFDRLYGGSEDPWGFDAHPEERLKFARTLDLCGPGPFGRALEIGCSIGTFTELLAPRCTSLLATDISKRAVRTALGRLGAFPQVTCEVRDLRQEFPEGPFDLIVASDVLYYWTIDEIVVVLRRIEQGLAPGGTLVALHYTSRIRALLNGNEVHDLLAQESRLDHVFTDETEFGDGRKYRVDLFARPARGATDSVRRTHPGAE